MSYKLYYPANPARRVAYLRDRSRKSYEYCGLALVVSFLLGQNGFIQHHGRAYKNGAALSFAEKASIGSAYV